MPKTKVGKRTERLSRHRKEQLKDEIIDYLSNCGHGMKKAEIRAKFTVFYNYEPPLLATILKELISESRLVMRGSNRDTTYFAGNFGGEKSFLPYESLQILLKKAKASNPHYDWIPFEYMLDLCRIELQHPRLEVYRKSVLRIDFTKCLAGDIITHPQGVEIVIVCDNCGQRGVLRAMATGATVVVHFAQWKDLGWETLKYCPLDTARFASRPISQDNKEEENGKN